MCKKEYTGVIGADGQFADTYATITQPLNLSDAEHQAVCKGIEHAAITLLRENLISDKMSGDRRQEVLMTAIESLTINLTATPLLDTIRDNGNHEELTILTELSVTTAYCNEFPDHPFSILQRMTDVERFEEIL